MEILVGLYEALHAPPFFGFLGAFLASYLLLAAASYAYLYGTKKHPLSHMKIQPARPSKKEIMRELFWSAISLTIWSAMAAVLVFLYQRGHTLLYASVDQYGWLYFFASIAVLIITHDAYFYWTHRLLHSRISFFSRMHDIHHSSLNPTPFAVYTFGPSEAVLLGLYFFAAAFILPLNIYALLSFFVLNTAFNAAGHLGYEFLPATIHEKAVGKLFNTSTHHNMHHQYGRSNFSLYFRFWDDAMKTQDAEYADTWKALHSRVGDRGV
jgi:lathosterol oxidase